MRVNWKLSLLIVGLLSPLPVLAANPGPSASANKTPEVVTYPMSQSKLAALGAQKSRISRIWSRVFGGVKRIGVKGAVAVKSYVIVESGRESTRAWTSIACGQPNPTLFGDCSTHEPSFGW